MGKLCQFILGERFKKVLEIKVGQMVYEGFH